TTSVDLASGRHVSGIANQKPAATGNRRLPSQCVNVRFVISGHDVNKSRCPLYPQKRTRRSDDFGLLEPSFSQALKKFWHLVRRVRNVLLAPSDRNIGLQFP